MHIERIHKMIEKLTECALCELDKGAECVNTKEFGEVVDMIKDLSEAEYKSLISKEMKEYKEEEEAEEKYMMRMLKDEHKDEYKKMREEYGEEDGERRFYDNYRYANGRFAPKGRGSYMPRSSGRRGYEEPPYYHMMPEMDYDPEWYRDMDRMDGKMYYSGSGMGRSASNPGNSSGRTGGMDGGNSGGNVRGYSEGYNDGYSEGERSGRNSRTRDGREGRSGQMRRSYMETKEMHKGNTPQDKQEKMKSLEGYMKELAEDVTEMVEDASPEERSLLKQKLQVLTQKIG